MKDEVMKVKQKKIYTRLCILIKSTGSCNINYALVMPVGTRRLRWNRSPTASLEGKRYDKEWMNKNQTEKYYTRQLKGLLLVKLNIPRQRLELDYIESSLCITPSGGSICPSSIVPMPVFIHLSIRQSVRLTICTTVSLTIHPSNHQSICPPIFLSACQPRRPSPW